LRLENIAGQLDVTAWVRNLTEEEYATDALDLSNFGFDIKVHGSPRTYGVTLDWRFE
jgi:iron complex outermembrane receptor protein